MTRSLAAILMTGALLAGCGTATPAPAAPAPASATPAAATPAATTPGGVPELTGASTDLTKAAQAQAGAGTAPSQLLTKDVVVGKGPAAKATDTVKVRYSGTLWTDGSLFDSSWSRGADPISFSLAEVVPGFTQGITGMQAGGRRELVIPPALGYGDRATGPIPAGSTLVFVVDLVSIG